MVGVKWLQKIAYTALNTTQAINHSLCNVYLHRNLTRIRKYLNAFYEDCQIIVA